jgi:RNA polymerase sigma factor (TIGR02999 family)
LPLVYDELRTVAEQRQAQEQPGKTLQATALVYEAYIRLVDVDRARHWNSRRRSFNRLRIKPLEVIFHIMTQVTQILSAIEQGDAGAAGQLLPLVYDELRKLAAQKLAQERPGQTLQATALVHEAYLRLVNVDKVQNWDSRGHFFAAAAEAMRRILVENARRKRSIKRGGRMQRVELDEDFTSHTAPDELLALNDALEKLAREDPVKAELVKLRCFAGLSHQEAAQALGISRATADRYWAYAKARLYCEIYEPEDNL